MQRQYSIITGASSGLGKEFALQCAARGMHLLLIALPGSNMKRMAKDLALQYQVDVQVFEFDLTDPDAFDCTLRHITENFSVNFLINNAGMGGTAHIMNSPLESIDKIIRLNIRSTVWLTHTLLPLLMQNKKSHILNVASMAAFSPIAYKTVYPASKAFISSFSLGLREELLHSGVSVSVVYPGAVMTNSNSSQRIVAQGLKARMGLLSVKSVVQVALTQTLKGKAMIIPGWWNVINQRLMNIIPPLVRTQMASAIVKQELSPRIISPAKNKNVLVPGLFPGTKIQHQF